MSKSIVIHDLAQLGSAIAERDRVSLDDFYENPAVHADVVRSHIGVWINEASEIDPEVFKKIRQRIKNEDHDRRAKENL